ncbi:YetF domain-containing protein [Alkalicoccobacillus murimartini]|uniref:Uncharacterized membrane protein YcaP (DUF421 family) n=1 Tax=Alkalicoccobacillus murimartini TaxID=171685 RepID=A0ABT9YC32_9BACI|nr:YetF domain-containing protein [Alkalicoccobacillus murimartini]MDQ0205402.1 uncharacterized membrane protein YcaP (DUF421 family) [Alkalicoccobacillus murimartini]
MLIEGTRALAIFGTLILFQKVARPNTIQPLLILGFTLFILISGPILRTQHNSVMMMIVILACFIFLMIVKELRQQAAVELNETITSEPQPLPVIMDGEIQYSQLEELQQNEFWLRRQIRDLGYRDIKRISYCSVRGDQLFYIDVMDKK